MEQLQNTFKVLLTIGWCRATYLRLQIYFQMRLLRSIYTTTYMTRLTFISSPQLYVYSLNLYGRTRQDILYHWHISWDYTIINLLSHLSHGLFFPILFARPRRFSGRVASFVVKHLAQLLILTPKYFPF